MGAVDVHYLWAWGWWLNELHSCIMCCGGSFVLTLLGVPVALGRQGAVHFTGLCQEGLSVKSDSATACTALAGSELLTHHGIPHVDLVCLV
jgi:hypothetical protein